MKHIQLEIWAIPICAIVLAIFYWIIILLTGFIRRYKLIKKYLKLGSPSKAGMVIDQNTPGVILDTSVPKEDRDEVWLASLNKVAPAGVVFKLNQDKELVVASLTD